MFNDTVVVGPSLDENQVVFDFLKGRSFKRGMFTLASGKKSDFYINCKETFLDRKGLWLLCGKLEYAIRDFEPEAIAGEGVGGIPLAIGVTVFSVFTGGSEVHPIIVRKETKDHGTGQRIEKSSGAVRKGAKVVLVEDVLTTGGSAMRAVQALREEEFDVRAVVAIVDRGEGAMDFFRENDVDCVTLYQRGDFFK